MHANINKEPGLTYDKHFADFTGKPFWVLDNSSVGWGKFGYEIIYRPEEMRASKKVINEIREAFMKPFGLPEDHYRFESTFWIIYWDKGQLSLSLLKECEKGLHEVACKNRLLIKMNGMIIQPRPLDYIHQQIELNRNK